MVPTIRESILCVPSVIVLQRTGILRTIIDIVRTYIVIFVRNDEEIGFTNKSLYWGGRAVERQMVEEQ